MDWRDPFGRKAKRRKAAEAAVKARTDIANAARERSRRQEEEARGEWQRRHDEIDRVQNQQLTDSQMTTNMGVFDSGVVLDGGAHHEHQHQDPPAPPPPAFDSSSSYDSSGSDSSGGSDF